MTGPERRYIYYNSDVSYTCGVKRETALNRNHGIPAEASYIYSQRVVCDTSRNWVIQHEPVHPYLSYICQRYYFPLQSEMGRTQIELKVGLCRFWLEWWVGTFQTKEEGEKWKIDKWEQSHRDWTDITGDHELLNDLGGLVERRSSQVLLNVSIYWYWTELLLNCDIILHLLVTQILRPWILGSMWSECFSNTCRAISSTAVTITARFVPSNWQTQKHIWIMWVYSEEHSISKWLHVNFEVLTRYHLPINLIENWS